MANLLDSFFVPLIVLAAALVMMCVEAATPGRAWPKVRGWYVRALLFNCVQAGVIVLAGYAWDGWLRSHQLWDGSVLGVTVGAAFGYVVSTFIYYWWHRVRHSSGFLWRWFHQFHHSPQRIEVITSFYKHPFELMANGVLSSIILYTVCGLDVQSAIYANMLAGLAELVYHWNVRTPHWIGYVFQRPEMHCVHHEEGLHHFNYGDLPLWDMMFGTFRNPPTFTATCGFGEENEHRVIDMMRGVDVNATPSQKGGVA